MAGLSIGMQQVADACIKDNVKIILKTNFTLLITILRATYLQVQEKTNMCAFTTNILKVSFSKWKTAACNAVIQIVSSASNGITTIQTYLHQEAGTTPFKSMMSGRRVQQPVGMAPTYAVMPLILEEMELLCSQVAIDRKMFSSFGIFVKTKNSEILIGMDQKFLRITQLKAKILKIKWKAMIRRMMRMWTLTKTSQVWIQRELVWAMQVHPKKKSQKHSPANHQHPSFMLPSSIINRTSSWPVVQVLIRFASTTMIQDMFFVSLATCLAQFFAWQTLTQRMISVSDPAIQSLESCLSRMPTEIWYQRRS